MKCRNIFKRLLKTNIIQWIVLIVSPLLLVWYREILMGNLLKAKKQFLVTGNMANYLSEVFSDPQLIMLTSIAAFLFGISLFLTIREIKYSKQKTYLLLGLLGADIIVFVSLLYCIFFTH